MSSRGQLFGGGGLLCILWLLACAAPVCAQGFPVLDPPVVAQNFTAIAPGVSTPPDTNGAVGPNHLLLATNGTVRIQDRTGTIVSSTSLLSFWSGMGISDAFDPRSYFDPYSQRFVIITCAERRNAASGMLFAVSATDDPTGVWHRWLLDADSTNVDWVDYGNLGFTNDEITFTGNMFSIAADNFAGVQFWRIDKASALSGGPLAFETFRVTGAGGTLVPVTTLDPAQTTQYIIRVGTSNLFGQGRVQLYWLGGALGSTTLSISANAAMGAPWSSTMPDAPQLGSAALIETNDDRIQSAVYRNGTIWCTHHGGAPLLGATRVGAKWWEVVPTTGLTLQDGFLEDPSGTSYYFPSITVNAQGLMMLGCSGSSATDYVGTYYAWRNPDTAPGVLEGVERYKEGVGAYTGPRWGDYSGIYLDPNDGTSIWVLQQYAEVSNRWGIQWAQLTIKQVNSLPVGRAGMAVLALVLLTAGFFAVRRRAGRGRALR